MLHRDRLFLGEGRKEKESIKDSQLLNWISKLLLLLLLVLVQTRADNKVWEQLVRCKFCFNHVRNTNPFGEWKKRKIRGKRKIQKRSFERILFNFLFHTRPIRYNFPLLVVFAKMIELSIISTRVSNKSLERSDSQTDQDFEGEEKGVGRRSFGIDGWGRRGSKGNGRNGFCETESRNRTPIIDRC